MKALAATIGDETIILTPRALKEGALEAGAYDSGAQDEAEAQAMAEEAEKLRLGQHKDAVSDECRRRIFEVASPTAQTNMTLDVGVISAKTASARSAEEKARLTAAEAALGWVHAMRAAFAVLAADPNADYLTDAAWPACPPEVQAIAAQF